MNYKQFFSDVESWLNQNNQAAQQLGFGSSRYWSWVVTSSGNLCNYYQNNPIALSVMLGLIKYLDGLIKRE